MSQQAPFQAGPPANLMKDKKSGLFSKQKQDAGPAAQPKKRVKTGCLTCRKRRIKCLPAEVGPVCINCAKTNRVCVPAPPVPAAGNKRRPSTKRTKSDQAIPLADQAQAQGPGNYQPPANYDYDFAQQQPSLFLQPGQPMVMDGYGAYQDLGQPNEVPLLNTMPNYQGPLGDYPQPLEDNRYAYLSPSLPGEVEVIDSFPFVHSTAGAYVGDASGELREKRASFSTQSASISTQGPLAAGSLAMDGLPVLPFQDGYNGMNHATHGNANILLENAMPQDMIQQPVDLQTTQPGNMLQNHAPLPSLQPIIPPANAAQHLSRSTSAKSSPQNMYNYLKGNTQYFTEAEAQTALEWRSPPPLTLTPQQQFFLNTFIANPPIGYGTLEEFHLEPPHPEARPLLHIRESDFWTFVIPNMALKCPALLHALLALSAVREANLRSDSSYENRALVDYHQAVRKLSKAIKIPGSSVRDELLAATLVLAYYETTSGETMRWGRHLEGSVFLVRQRIASTYNLNENAKFQFLKDPTTAEHLIWFHIHQDAIQGLLSGTGLYLELQYIQAMPLRGKAGSVMHSTDQLRVLMARVGDFVGRDRRRKEAGQTDQQSLEHAFREWNTLLGDFNAWKGALSPDFEPRVIPGTFTPFGDVLVHQHPSIATVATLHLACLICLHRYRPDLSLVPAQAGKAVMMTTFPLSQTVLRMLSGIMVEGINNKQVEHTSHVKAMVNSVMPAFLAGTSLQDADQRDYLDRVLKDIFSFTGWRTALRVCQGLDVAWGRTARGFHGLMTSIDADPKVAREKRNGMAGSIGASSPRSSSDGGRREGGSIEGGGAAESRFVLLDKSQALNAVVGVLGRLELVEDGNGGQSLAQAPQRPMSDQGLSHLQPPLMHQQQRLSPRTVSVGGGSPSHSNQGVQYAYDA